MKKLFLIILTFALLCACCAKEPLPKEVPAEENKETEEALELEKYASSEEALGFVKRIARVLGGTKLDSIGQPQPWVLAQMLLPEIEQTGKKINIEHLNQTEYSLETEEYIALIEKHFGKGCISDEDKKYMRETTETGIYAEVHQWETEKIEFDGIKDNIASYSLILKNLHCGCPCSTSAKFEIKEDENGFYLCFVSNIPEKTKTFTTDYRWQAEELAKQLAESLKSGIEGKSSLGTEDILVQNFIFKMPAYTNHGEGCRRNAPYFGELKIGLDATRIFPENKVEKILLQVLENYDYSNFEWGENFDYDEKRREYSSGLGWGMESAYSCKVISSQRVRNDFSVVLELFGTESVNGNPQKVSRGKYTANFEFVNYNYLRFKGMVKNKAVMPKGCDFCVLLAFEQGKEKVTLDIPEYSLAEALKWESWTELPEGADASPTKESPKTVLYTKNGDELCVYSNGKDTVIKMIWGENRENENFFIALPESAQKARNICDELIHSAFVYGTLPSDLKTPLPMPNPADFDEIWIGGYGGTTYDRIVLTDYEYSKMQNALRIDEWQEYSDEQEQPANHSESLSLYISSDKSEGHTNGQMYLYPYGSYTLVSVKWDYYPQQNKKWLAPKNVYSKAAEVFTEVNENAKADGRKAYLSEEEEEYVYKGAENFNNDYIYFLRNLIYATDGSFDEYNRPAPESCVAVCALEVMDNPQKYGAVLEYDENREPLISAQAIKTAAYYIFGIRDITKHYDFENGYYKIVPEEKIIMPKIASVEENGSYISFRVEFYDPDGFGFEEKPYAEKYYGLRVFEVNGMTHYRAAAAGFAYGEEWNI